MSNLNDFIGGTSLNFWRSEGFNNISTHGPYDGATSMDVVYGPNLEILGTTSDTHHFGKELKLHHVPDRRVFANYGSEGAWYVKINLSADKTNAPSPTEDVTHKDNLVPTLQAVIRCFSYKIYTKQSESDSYVLKDTISMATESYPTPGHTNGFGTATPYAAGIPMLPSNSNLNTRFITWPYYSSSTSGANNIHWQGGFVTGNNFGQLQLRPSAIPSLDESFLTTDNTGPIFIKTQWELDTTAYNAIFSRSYNEVEGIKLMNLNDTTVESLYTGQRSYTHKSGDEQQEGTQY